MVEINLSAITPSRGGPVATSSLRDGMRLALRVIQDLGGGRAVLEGSGLRLEVELGAPVSRGSLIEAVVRSSADGILLEILGGSPPPATGTTETPLAAPPGTSPAGPAEVLASIGLPDTAANRAAAEALLAEGEPLTEAAVREVAAALDSAGEVSAERARAIVRLIAAGVPPSARLSAADAAGPVPAAGMSGLLAEAASALAELAASDPAYAGLAGEVAAIGAEPGDAASLRGYVEGAAGRLLEVLAAIESRAAETLSSVRLASLDSLVEMLSARTASQAGPAGIVAPPLDELVTPGGSLATNAAEVISALGPGAAAELLALVLDAERAEISAAAVSPQLARAARAIRGALSRAVLPRAAALAGWESAGAGGAGGLTLEIPVAAGTERVIVRLRIRRGGGRPGTKGGRSRPWRVAVAVTMSVLGPVLAELRIRAAALDGVVRLTTADAVRAVESRIGELTARLAEEGLAAQLSVEEISPGAGDELAGREVSPDIRKVDLHA